MHSSPMHARATRAGGARASSCRDHVPLHAEHVVVPRAERGHVVGHVDDVEVAPDGEHLRQSPGAPGRAPLDGATALASSLCVSLRVIAAAADARPGARCLATGAGAGAAVKDGGDFYTPPANMPKKAPGTIIRSTPITAPSGAKAWKVLYHSRSVDGRDIAVSGVVVVPTGAAPKGGRPVVTWAHGTTGLGDQCAPSKAADAATHVPVREATRRRGLRRHRHRLRGTRHPRRAPVPRR